MCCKGIILATSGSWHFFNSPLAYRDIKTSFGGFIAIKYRYVHAQLSATYQLINFWEILGFAHVQIGMYADFDS